MDMWREYVAGYRAEMGSWTVEIALLEAGMDPMNHTASLCVVVDRHYGQPKDTSAIILHHSSAAIKWLFWSCPVCIFTLDCTFHHSSPHLPFIPISSILRLFEEVLSEDGLGAESWASEATDDLLTTCYELGTNIHRCLSLRPSSSCVICPVCVCVCTQNPSIKVATCTKAFTAIGLRAQNSSHCKCLMEDYSEDDLLSLSLLMVAFASNDINVGCYSLLSGVQLFKSSQLHYIIPC